MSSLNVSTMKENHCRSDDILLCFK